MNKEIEQLPIGAELIIMVPSADIAKYGKIILEKRASKTYDNEYLDAVYYLRNLTKGKPLYFTDESLHRF